MQDVTGLHALGRDDVAALAVGIKKQCNVSGAVGVVFNALNLSRNTVLVRLKSILR